MMQSFDKCTYSFYGHVEFVSDLELVKDLLHGTVFQISASETHRTGSNGETFSLVDVLRTNETQHICFLE